MMTPLYAAYKKVPLVLQIVIGLVIGTLLALFCPEQTSFVKGFGDLFVKALKSVAPLLVLVLVTSAIAAHKKDTPNQLWKLMIIYFISTFLAAVTAVGASFLFPISVTLAGTAGEGGAAASSISVISFMVHPSQRPNILSKSNCFSSAASTRFSPPCPKWRWILRSKRRRQKRRHRCDALNKCFFHKP